MNYIVQSILMIPMGLLRLIKLTRSSIAIEGYVALIFWFISKSFSGTRLRAFRENYIQSSPSLEKIERFRHKMSGYTLPTITIPRKE